jgi:hypothetical protein
MGPAGTPSGKPTNKQNGPESLRGRFVSSCSIITARATRKATARCLLWLLRAWLFTFASPTLATVLGAIAGRSNCALRRTTCLALFWGRPLRGRRHLMLDLRFTLMTHLGPAFRPSWRFVHRGCSFLLLGCPRSRTRLSRGRLFCRRECGTPRFLLFWMLGLLLRFARHGPLVAGRRCRRRRVRFDGLCIFAFVYGWRCLPFRRRP